jgi:hypothetical protein
MEHYTWDEMPKEEMSELIGRKIISGEKAMVAQVFIAKGAVVPEHQHESEQITYILEGALKFQLEGKEIVAHPVERAPSRGGARRHARPGHLQPDPPRLAEKGRRLPSQR